MARMKFLCDADRCIECNACVTACKNENEVPWGINRRRVVTINDGKPGERSVSMACMHCTDAPCAAVCPVTCIFSTDDGVVLHSKDLCIGCGYCFYACPFGAPQYPKVSNFGSRGKMDIHRPRHLRSQYHFREAAAVAADRAGRLQRVFPGRQIRPQLHQLSVRARHRHDCLALAQGQHPRQGRY